MTTDYLPAIFSVVCTTFAQLLMKKVAHLRGSIFHPFSIFSYVLFVFATIGAVLAFSRLPMKSVTLFASLAYPSVAVGSSILFGEKVNLRGWVGIVLIISGIAIATIEW